MNTPRRPRLMVCLLALSLVGLTAGCATGPSDQPLYRWGDYEHLVYQMYAQPGQAEPGLQVEKLSADIERTQAEGKRVPPGVHAHLGYMQYLQGNTSQAAEEFATERELYPESSTFMTTFIKRLQAGN